MAKDQGVNMPTAKGPAKASGPAKPPIKAAAAPAVVTSAPKKRTSPAQFIQEVRAEARKISWTSWKETWIISTLVMGMVVITALFLRVVDFGLGLMIQQILKLAS